MFSNLKKSLLVWFFGLTVSQSDSHLHNIACKPSKQLFGFYFLGKPFESALQVYCTVRASSVLNSTFTGRNKVKGMEERRRGKILSRPATLAVLTPPHFNIPVHKEPYSEITKAFVIVNKQTVLKTYFN